MPKNVPLWGFKTFSNIVSHAYSFKLSLKIDFLSILHPYFVKGKLQPNLEQCTIYYYEGHTQETNHTLIIYLKYFVP